MTLLVRVALTVQGFVLLTWAVAGLFFEWGTEGERLLASALSMVLFVHAKGDRRGS